MTTAIILAGGMGTRQRVGPHHLLSLAAGALLATAFMHLLPEAVELISGPGCPVCVTPLAMIDRALALAGRPEVTLCSFGDMLRVPGSEGDLFQLVHGAAIGFEATVGGAATDLAGNLGSGHKHSYLAYAIYTPGNQGMQMNKTCVFIAYQGRRPCYSALVARWLGLVVQRSVLVPGRGELLVSRMLIVRILLK